MKKAFLVVGAEATGTKLVTECLLAGGCHGDAGNDQWVKKALDNAYSFESDPVVLRLSFPCGLEWPRLDDVLWHLKCRGYSVSVLVTVRDWYACRESQTHQDTHAFNLMHSQNKMQRAYREIFGALAFTGVPFCIVPYESLVARQRQAIGKLLAWCGLTAGKPLPQVYDANAKWYDQEDTQDHAHDAYKMALIAMGPGGGQEG